MGQRRRVRLPPGFRRGQAHPVGGRPGHLPPGDAAFPGRQRHSYYPTFNVPHEIAPAAADAGFRSCTTASNHTIDKGLAGVQTTLNALDAAGIAHVGAARSAEEAATPKIYELGGVRVGHLDYTYGLNGQRLPASAPWIVKLIDPAQILADAKAVRAAGAQFVLVSMHWGEEYQAAPTAQQRSIAQ